MDDHSTATSGTHVAAWFEPATADGCGNVAFSGTDDGLGVAEATEDSRRARFVRESGEAAIYPHLHPHPQPTPALPARAFRCPRVGPKQ